jgi:hypothetical protein
VYGRGEYTSGRGMLAPVGGKRRVESTLDPGADGNVDGRRITSERPVKAPPACGVPNERDGGCMRAKETARAS